MPWKGDVAFNCLLQDTRRDVLTVSIGAELMDCQIEAHWQRQRIGLDPYKNILTESDHYDGLALGPNFIRFINAEDVNKKSYRIKPEDLDAGLAGDTWREITHAL